MSLTGKALADAVRNDAEAAYLLAVKPPQVLSPWQRGDNKSQRLSPGADHDTLCYECGAGPQSVTVAKRTVTPLGYYCRNGCKRTGRSGYCGQCGSSLSRSPGMQAWSVTALPSDLEPCLRMIGHDYYFTAKTREAAEEWADDVLRGRGYLLCNANPETKS